MPKRKHHTPISGGANIKTALNTALGQIDSAITTELAQAFGLNVGVLWNDTRQATETGTWHNFDITDSSFSPSTFGTISDNKFLPEAGVYLLAVHAHNSGVGAFKCRLYNVTQASVHSYFATGDVESGTFGEVHGYTVFTANGTDEYRVDIYCANSGFLGISGDPVQESITLLRAYTT